MLIIVIFIVFCRLEDLHEKIVMETMGMNLY